MMVYSNKQKKLWNKLAKENSKYYIYTYRGEGIDDIQFEMSAEQDYMAEITNDRFLTKHFPKKNKVVAMDLGCGIGRLTKIMAGDFGVVLGVDISGEMIRQAKKRLKLYNNIELYENDGYTLPISDNSVDFVFSFLVFQHMKTLAMVESNFREVYRVLKPGGIFKVQLRQGKMRKIDKWWNGVAFDSRSADQLIRQAGLTWLQSDYTEGGSSFWLWLEK
jgi:ubiquinone/menaquinone biosynthesis C-methylase UbiE